MNSLAVTLFKNYVGQAETEAQAFIQASKDNIASDHKSPITFHDFPLPFAALPQNLLASAITSG